MHKNREFGQNETEQCQQKEISSVLPILDMTLFNTDEKTKFETTHILLNLEEQNRFRFILSFCLKSSSANLNH